MYGFVIIIIGNMRYKRYSAIHPTTLEVGDITKLKGFENEYRLRIGDLRVLFTLENDIITINNVKPRGEAYKRL